MLFKKSFGSRHIHSKSPASSRHNTCKLLFICCSLTAVALERSVQAQPIRSLGIDVSAHQPNITSANWATLKRPTNEQVGGVFGDGRDFVMIRASRGGTTGEDHRQGGYPSGNNTLYYGSQRYDDPYYVQNISAATAAGLLAGSYHFSRPDVIVGTVNSDGTTNMVANTGTDEANHFIAMAGPWMRPGYLPPILDLEAGDGIRSDNAMAQFCVDFSERIYQVMGIRPGIYINGNYAANILETATSPSPTLVVADFPCLWTARWPNQADPNSIDWQNAQPKDSYTPIYGPWDNYGITHPWKFWQYASTAHVNAIGNGGVSCDVDVAQGPLEFVKDQLIPAVWLNNTSGEWTTLSNWNSGQTPTPPVTGPGQLGPYGTQIYPTPRLPSINDTVILDRGANNITVTLSSGTQNIRKLIALEALNITGGSLNANYTPTDPGSNSVQFAAAATLGIGAGLSANAIRVDAGNTFTVNGGTLSFNLLRLMPSTPAGKLVIGGDATWNTLTGSVTVVTNGGTFGSANSGSIDLAAGTRAINVPVNMDLSFTVPIGNGGLTRTGAGMLRLTGANTYAGGTTISSGTLSVNNTSGSGTGSGAVIVNGGTLTGSGIISGVVTVNSGGTLAPGPQSSLGTMTLNSAPVLNGTTFVRVNRNGGSPLADKLTLTSGSLNFGGTLVVSNAGAAFIGGESFTNFVAPARAGAFASNNLPSLALGLNWYLGDLVSFGRIKVNRAPVAASTSVTNKPGQSVFIPFSNLVAAGSDPDSDPVAINGVSLTTSAGVILTTNATGITYETAQNSADTITYTLTDGHGGLATGTVSIVPSTTGSFTSQPNVGGASVEIHLLGAPGATYFLERSTNLPDWMTIVTNVMPSNGVVDYVDSFSDLGGVPPPSAFYRLRWLQP
jgi:autotransporter-associated beta strand protein